MTRWRRSWFVVASSAIILAGPLVEAAVAKRPRARLSATVDGKRLKSMKRVALGAVATTSFSVNGQTKPRRGRSRSITVLCGPVNIRLAVLPTTLTGCYGTYLETQPFKQWDSNSMELTVESLDGTHTVGTFRGTIQPSLSNPSEPPVSIEGGSFSIFLLDTGV